MQAETENHFKSESLKTRSVIWVVDDDSNLHDMVDQAIVTLGCGTSVAFLDGWHDFRLRVKQCFMQDLAAPSVVLMDLHWEEHKYYKMLHEIKPFWPNTALVIWEDPFYRSRRKELICDGASEVLRKPSNISVCAKMLDGIKKRWLQEPSLEVV
jgi:DNA-binding NarL/FixJ family response regulator